MKLGGIFLLVLLAIGIIPVQYFPIDSGVMNHLIPNAYAAPVVAIFPTSGPVGTLVTVTGSNFVASHAIAIKIGSQRIADAGMTDTTGKFVTTFVVASQPISSNAVIITDGFTIETAGTFTVTTITTMSLSPINGTWASGQKIELTLVDHSANKNPGNNDHLNVFDPTVDRIPTMTIGSPLTIESGNSPTAIFAQGGLSGRLLGIAKDDSVDAKISGRAMLVDNGNFSISNGDSLIVDLHNNGQSLLNTINEVTGSNNDFRGYNLFNYDVRSILVPDPGSPFLPTVSTSVFLIVNNAGTGILDRFGNVTNGQSQLIPLGTSSGGSGLLFLNHNALSQNQQPLTDLSHVSSTASIGLMFTINTNGDFVINNSRMPMVADFFSIGIIGDGSKGDQRINNAIYRWQLGETNANNGIFTGTSQYVMLNQLNIFDPNTYSSLRTMDSAIKFAAISDMRQSEARGPAIKYLNTVNNSTISAEQDIRTSTGIPTFDKIHYNTGDTVTVTLSDRDLNVNNDLVDVYVAVPPGNLTTQDVATDTIGASGLGTNPDGSAFGKLMEIVFGNDDARWSNTIIPNDPNHRLSCTFVNPHGAHGGNIPGITTGGFDPSLSATGFTLVETGPSTGIFTGTFSFPDEVCQKGVVVPTANMDIKAKYFDFADNSGQSNERDDYVGGYGFVDTLKIMPQFASLTKVNQVIPQPNESVVPVVVFFRNSSSVLGGIKELQLQANVTVGNTIDIVPSIAATIPVSELDNISNKFVVAIFRDSKIFPASLDVDSTIDANTVWTSSSFTGSGKEIAVLDTGVDLANPEFSSSTKIAGCHDAIVTATPDECVDKDGHGTHVSGIALAAGTSRTSLTGVAKDASLMSVKVISGSTGSWTTAGSGISWAVIHGADVINMSFEDNNKYGSNCDQNPSVTGILPYLIAASVKGYGIPLVAASGNHQLVSAPGCISYVIAVGAVDGTGNLFTDPLNSLDSGTGKSLEDHGLVAPGVGVISTWMMGVPTTTSINGVEKDSGTSMAAPAVAGTIALMLEKNNTMTPRTIAQILFNSACRTTSPSCVSSPMINMSNELFGHGMVNASAAVDLVGTTLPSFTESTTQESFALNPITVGQSIVVNAVAFDSSFSAITTGTVAFDDNRHNGTFSSNTNTCQLDPGIACQITYTPTTTGAIMMTAWYKGDGTHDSSYERVVLHVNPSTSVNPTTTTIQPLPVIHVGSSVSFTAIVTDTSLTPTNPTGTVNFIASGGSFGTVTCTPSGSDELQCSATYFAPSISGPVTITANYLPTSMHTASSGSTSFTVQTATGIPTSITIQPSPTFTVKQGNSMDFTAIVTDTSTTPTNPTGTVNFNVVSGVGGFFGAVTCNPSGSDQLQCSSTYNAPSSSGNVTISASYRPSATDLHNAMSIQEDGKVTDCLIATAAFGSVLSPQVQFLRDFRDNDILSTTDGSSFMIAFNAWYYSFSPYVANFEDTQPWFKQIVRTSIYPLIGILTVSEKSYSVMPGEFGSLSAGLVAVSLIGTVYFWPFALVSRKIRSNQKYNYKMAVIVCSSALLATMCSVIIGNQTALIITTSVFVLSLAATFATMSASAIVRAFYVLKNRTRIQ